MSTSTASNYKSFLDSVEAFNASTHKKSNSISKSTKKAINSIIGKKGKEKDNYQNLDFLKEEDKNPLLENDYDSDDNNGIEILPLEIRNSEYMNPTGARYSLEQENTKHSKKQQKQHLLSDEYETDNDDNVIHSLKQNKTDGYCSIVPDDSLYSLNSIPKVYIPPITPISYEEFTAIVEEVKLAINEGINPTRIKQGSSGSYFCYNRKKEIVGIFKPKNEEPYGNHNPKWTKWIQRNLFPCFFGRGCLVPNLGYISEAAASYVDRRLHLNIVPRTEIISLASPSFYYNSKELQDYYDGKCPLPKKKGSFQIYMTGYKDANIFFKEGYDQLVKNKNGMSNESSRTNLRSLHSIYSRDNLQDIEHPFKWSLKTQKEFQWQFERLVVLDYLIRNTDRGLDNWLIKYEEVQENDSNIQSQSQEVLDLFSVDSNEYDNKDEVKVFSINDEPISHPLQSNTTANTVNTEKEDIPPNINNNIYQNENIIKNDTINDNIPTQNLIDLSDPIENNAKIDNKNSTKNSDIFDNNNNSSSSSNENKEEKENEILNEIDQHIIDIQPTEQEEMNINPQNKQELNVFKDLKEINSNNFSLLTSDNKLKDSNVKISLRIAAIDNGLAFPYKHPDEWRSYPYGWAFLPISQIPFSAETRSILPLLTSNSWWIETFKGLEQLFRIDPNFNEKMWRNQKAVMRGQGYNLIEVLNRSVLNTVDGSPSSLVKRPVVSVYEEEENSDDEYDDEYIENAENGEGDWVAISLHKHRNSKSNFEIKSNNMTTSVKRQYQKVKQQFVTFTQDQPCFTWC